jgi:hypothetical protein
MVQFLRSKYLEHRNLTSVFSQYSEQSLRFIAEPLSPLKAQKVDFLMGFAKSNDI